MQLVRSALLSLCVMSMAACASAAGTVRVAKTLGSRQCEGGGVSLSELQRQLVQGGVKVQSAACGTDGRMRPAMCGAGDGRIGVFEIAAADQKAAAALGFAPLKEGEGATAASCP